MENSLPKGWEELILKDVVEYGKGKKPKKLEIIPFENSIPYLNIKSLEKGIIDEYADIASSNVADLNNLFVVWDGARSGWVGKGKYGAIGSTLMALKPLIIDQGFLYLFLQGQFNLVNSNPIDSGIPH